MKINKSLKIVIIAILLLGFVTVSAYFIFLLKDQKGINELSLSNDALGWKFPTVTLPSAGSVKVAVSSIRDTDTNIQGLPVRLKIPTMADTLV